MDFGFTEEQEMLRTSARDFLTTECPADLVKEMAEDQQGYKPDMWAKIAELGWMGLAFPEQYEGMGMTFLDLAVLLEEMGRAVLPGPFFSSVVEAGFAVLEAGSEEQKKEILSKIATGETIATLAVTEPSASYEASAIAVTAKAEGDGYVIDGTKLFVDNAHIADYIIVAARTKEGGKPEEGITLFVVEGKAPGITTTLLKTISGSKQCEVIFDKVKVPKANVLGDVDKGWPRRYSTTAPTCSSTWTARGSSPIRRRGRCPRGWRPPWRFPWPRLGSTRPTAASPSWGTRYTAASGSAWTTTCRCTSRRPRPASRCSERPTGTARRWRRSWACSTASNRRFNSEGLSLGGSPLHLCGIAIG